MRNLFEIYLFIEIDFNADEWYEAEGGLLKFVTLNDSLLPDWWICLHL